MIALDASALADWLLATPGRSRSIAADLAGAGEVHTLDFASLEVVSVVRRKVRAGDLTQRRASQVVDDLLDTPLVRHAVTPLAARAFELRSTHSPYDAAYVALAEALAAPLLTADRRLARSHGHRAEIRLAT